MDPVSFFKWVQMLGCLRATVLIPCFIWWMNLSLWYLSSSQFNKAERCGSWDNLFSEPESTSKPTMGLGTFGASTVSQKTVKTFLSWIELTTVWRPQSLFRCTVHSKGSFTFISWTASAVWRNQHSTEQVSRHQLCQMGSNWTYLMLAENPAWELVRYARKHNRLR